MTAPASKAEAIRDHLRAETRVLRDTIARVLAGTSDRFRWLESELWIDRERWLVLGADYAGSLGLLQPDAAPADIVAGEGPRHSVVRINAVISFLAGWFVGRVDARRDQAACAEWANFAAVPALIDPAFDSLCWLVLDYGCRPHLQEPFRIGSLAGPMIPDLARLPNERDPLAEARAAQVRFVREHFAPDLEPAWEHAPPEAWAQRCAEILAEDARFLFDQIEHRAGRI